MRVDLYPLGLRHVHLVEGDYHVGLQLQELDGEEEVPLKGRGVEDVDEDIGVLDGDVLPAHQLLDGVGGEAVDPREVDYVHHVFPEHKGPLRPLHCLPRPVPYVLVEPSELVEDDALPDVGVPSERNTDGFLYIPNVSLPATPTMMSVLHRILPRTIR